MLERRLKVALLCQSPDAVDPWMLRLAERICTSDDLELSGLLYRAQTKRQKVRTVLGPWWTIESKFAARSKPAVTPTLDTKRSELAAVALTDISAIKSLDLDVIIDLTTAQGREVDPQLARYGVWHLEILTPQIGGASVRSILRRDRLMDINLECQQQGQAGAQRIATATVNTKFIAALNHLYVCEKSVGLILRELNRLKMRGSIESLGPTPKATSKALSLVSLIQYAFHLGRSALGRIGQKLGAKLGIRPGMFYLQTSTGELTKFDPAQMTPHPVAGNRYYADPFLWVEKGETYCFFEIYDYRTLHGHLGVGQLKDGVLTDVRSIIKNDYHMSYPFLFRHNGELYMLPETCGAKRIELWKCVEFPHRWERDRIILDNVIAADSSIAEIDGAWWLFTNISTDPFGEMNSELHIYKIDGPDLQDLKPHPLNPVVFDARTARNGGRILSENGVTFRASQNNSHGLYGYGLNLMRIETLSMTDYAETAEREITPDFQSGLIGCHHIDKRGDTVVIDVRRRIGGRTR